MLKQYADIQSVRTPAVPVARITRAETMLARGAIFSSVIRLLIVGI